MTRCLSAAVPLHACSPLLLAGPSAAPRRDAPASWPGALRRDWGDRLTFLARWWRDPRGMAAIAPSGRALAALITREIDPAAGALLELGSGTGAFVPALLARGVAERDLTLVEQDPALARRLARRYPHAQVLAIDAARLGAATSRRYGAAVCGLGLLAMPPATVAAILRAALDRMTPDARLYLFTYGRRCSVPADVLRALRLEAEVIGTAWWNLPPARVYRLTRVRGRSGGDAR
jgi:phosphatidylethanolamine/phosphatidyl-N-methylethanolamine N-methyltransferase